MIPVRFVAEVLFKVVAFENYLKRAIENIYNI
jgi:hypothetical protein